MSRLLFGGTGDTDRPVVDSAPLRGSTLVALVMMVGFSAVAARSYQSRAGHVASVVAAPGHIGVVIRDMTACAAARAGNGAPTAGALVLEVEARSAAAMAGVQPGDVVTQLDGVAVAGATQMQHMVLASTVGKPLAVHVWRRGATLNLVARPTAETTVQERRRTAPCACSDHP